MTTVKEVINTLNTIAPLALQESYDNSGLIVGNPLATVTGVLLCVDVTEAQIEEALEKDCNLIVCHHPLVFKGLTSVTGKNYVERCVIEAIKNDIAIYAGHTNFDAILTGVNGILAQKLGVENCKILLPTPNKLQKLVVFVPEEYAEAVRQAAFAAGGGNIGQYDCCSFNSTGIGTFRPLEGSKPFVGEIGSLHREKEVRVEIIVPSFITQQVLAAIIDIHPYQEVAYDIISLDNNLENAGSGLIGMLEEPEDESIFLSRIKNILNIPILKHSPLTGRKIKKVALCGGSGAFLISRAIGSGADFFLTGELKYHDYFLAEDNILLADGGHFETEQFILEVFYDILNKKFSNFAVRYTEYNSNPVKYF